MSIRADDLHGVSFDDVVDGNVRQPPVSPGEILREEFMVPLGLSARALARELNWPPNRVTAILNGARSITADSALALSARFNTSAELWMNLQVRHDLEIARRAKALAA